MDHTMFNSHWWAQALVDQAQRAHDREVALAAHEGRKPAALAVTDSHELTVEQKAWISDRMRDQVEHTSGLVKTHAESVAEVLGRHEEALAHAKTCENDVKKRAGEACSILKAGHRDAKKQHAAALEHYATVSSQDSQSESAHAAMHDVVRDEMRAIVAPPSPSVELAETEPRVEA